MKIIRNSIIPFEGFLCINLFGILFVRGNRYVSDIVINHESIHTQQMKELWYIPYYIWYVIEWIVRLFQYNFTHKAYHNISFEREAYDNESNMEYLQKREKFISFKFYLKNK